VIHVGEVEALRRIEPRDGGLWLGAAATLADAWAALAERQPTLTEMGLRFASPPIRHAGTLGGNLANGSPIGDGAPVLMALDAELELRLGTQVRRIALRDFYVGYMQNRLAPGEFVQAVWVPPLPASRQVRAYKISKRFDSDISAVCAGFSIECGGDGTVTAARLAYGGMAATVQRAARAEAVLIGQPWAQAAVRAAQQALSQDFAPLDDLRGSAAYRTTVAANLLQRFWLETRPDDPLPANALRVHGTAGPSGEGAFA
jgi:xanthine dehydrogenase small subunit